MRIAEPCRERLLFELHGNETLGTEILHHTAADAYAAIVAAGRHVGPFRVVSSIVVSIWLRGVSRLTLSGDGAALAYVEEHEDGCFVIGTSRWGPYHWIAVGPRFDATGTSVAWIEDLAGGGQVLWVDGAEVARASAGSWDPHEGSPLSLPYSCGLPDDHRPDIHSTRCELRAGHWQARIDASLTAPVQWMSDPISKAANLVGCLVREGAAIYRREYHCRE